MTLTFIFWLIMLLWILGGVVVGFRPAAGDFRYTLLGSSLLLFILFLIVGLKLFGFPIKGG